MSANKKLKSAKRLSRSVNANRKRKSYAKSKNKKNSKISSKSRLKIWSDRHKKC